MTCLTAVSFKCWNVDCLETLIEQAVLKYFILYKVQNSFIIINVFHSIAQTPVSVAFIYIVVSRASGTLNACEVISDCYIKNWKC